MNVIAKAKAQIAEHEAQIVRLLEFIAVHRELEGDDTAMVAPPPRRTAQAKSGRGGAAPAKKVVDAAKKIILKAGKPMTRFELLPALQEAKVIVGGKEPTRNLGTIMWRSKTFQSTGEGYWPLGVPRGSLFAKDEGASSAASA